MAIFWRAEGAGTATVYVTETCDPTLTIIAPWEGPAVRPRICGILPKYVPEELVSTTTSAGSIERTTYPGAVVSRVKLPYQCR